MGAGKKDKVRQIILCLNICEYSKAFVKQTVNIVRIPCPPLCSMKILRKITFVFT